MNDLSQSRFGMTRKIILAILTMSIILSCNNSKDKNMVTDKAEAKITEASTSGYAPANGLEMYYEIHGEGTPLVLIHGGGSTIQTTFGNILPFLAKHFKVIAVELQAHGHTNDRNSPESFEQDADDVAVLLKYLKINKAHFFGFSNGGNTAMQIAIRHASIVNKLIIASSFYKRDGMIPGFFNGMEHAILDNMPAPLKSAYLQVASDKNGLQTMFNKDRTRMLQFKDWPDEALFSITAPALLVAGDKDVVTAEHVVEMSRKIPGAELMIVPGNHGSYIGEICSVSPGSKLPEITLAIIEEFLNK